MPLRKVGGGGAERVSLLGSEDRGDFSPSGRVYSMSSVGNSDRDSREGSLMRERSSAMSEDSVIDDQTTIALGLVFDNLDLKASTYSSFSNRLYRTTQAYASNAELDAEIEVMLPEILDFLTQFLHHQILFDRNLSLKNTTMNKLVELLGLPFFRIPEELYNKTESKFLDFTQNVYRQCFFVFETMFGIDNIDMCYNILEKEEKMWWASGVIDVLFHPFVGRGDTYDGVNEMYSTCKDIVDYIKLLDEHLMNIDKQPELDALIAKISERHPKLSRQLFKFAKVRIDSYMHLMYGDYEDLLGNILIPYFEEHSKNIRGENVILSDLYHRAYAKFCVRSFFVRHSRFLVEFTRLTLIPNGGMGRLFQSIVNAVEEGPSPSANMYSTNRYDESSD